MTSGRRRWVSGHNLRNLVRTPTHCAAIAAAQRKAWQTKRKRLPVGSTMIAYDGYMRVKVLPGKGRWTPQHILVAQEMLGRPLAEAECVHHVNGDRTDNRRENLYVCRDRSQHSDVHRSESMAFRQLLAAGLVVFKDGRYEAVLPG